MSKRLALGAVVLACVACLVVPSAAFAKARVSATGIRATHSSYTYVGVGGSVEVSGKLVIRKRVLRKGHWRTVDAPLNGGVHLQRLDEETGQWKTVAWKQTSRSIVRFEVSKDGAYRLLHPRTRTTRASASYTEVMSDVLSIDSLGAVSATKDRSGDVFVTLGADFQAPAGVVTTATPGAAVFVVLDGAGLPIDTLVGLSGVRLTATTGTIGSLDDPFMGLSNGFLSVLRRTGVYRYGFTVPAAQADDTFVVEAGFMASQGHVVPKSAAATFTPSSFLP